jgi:AcrR family transcriptional regulator
MSKTPRRWSDETHARLLRAGIEAFGAHGFEALSEDARGALQYQFGGKRGLFEAALDHVLGETQALLSDRTMERAHSIAELWEGVGVMMDLALDDHRRRLMFVDAPAVLGWSAWRERLNTAFEPLLHHALGHWVEAGLITEADVPGYSEVILSAGLQAALAQSAGDSRPREALVAMIQRLAGR